MRLNDHPLSPIALCVALTMSQAAAAAGVADALGTIGDALRRSDARAARLGMEQLRQTCVAELGSALAARKRRANRRTYDRLVKAQQRLDAVDRHLRAMQYAQKQSLAYTGRDAAKLALALGAGEAAAMPTAPRLELRPSWFLRATDELLIWTLNGSMRVPREGFAVPDRVWLGNDLRHRLAAETVDGLAVEEPGSSEVRLAAAVREYEPFQIVITPRARALKIGPARASDFVSESGGGRIAKSNVEVNLVGYVWGKDRGRDTGPFPDVLLPESHQVIAEPGQNYTLWFTVYVPPGAPSGAYRSTVTLNVDGGDIEPIPVRLRVWDFELPEATRVATQLFSLDLNSLCYWYNVAPWEDRAQRLMRDFMENMARHRFSPAGIPPHPRPQFESFPRRIEGRHGHGLRVRGEKLQLAGPRFEQMETGFTFCWWMRADSPGAMPIVKQQWLDRPSGYWIEMTESEVAASVGYGTREPDPLAGTIRASWPRDGQWHHVALTYRPGAAELLIDGRAAGRAALDWPLSPSFSYVTIGGEGAACDLDELRWAARPLAADQVGAEMGSAQPVHCRLAAYSFDDDAYDFTARAKPGGVEELNSRWFWQWVDWCGDRGLFLNNLPRPIATEDLTAFVRDYCEPLMKKGLLSRAYARLPHDEATSGPAAEHNRAWAKAVHGLCPGLKRHQTLGNMGGSRVSHQQKQNQVTAYFGLVDIWSMRPLIFSRLHESHFRQRIEAGDELSLYIHDCNVVERDASTSGRFFFWYLWKYQTNMCTLWNTNLWFQPIKRGGRRAEKRTWEVDWGFWTTRRNPSGIVCGSIFWPGRDRILNSIRSENWREGIEDYEYLHLLKTRLDEATVAGVGGKPVDDATALLDEVANMRVYGRQFATPPTTDASWVFDHRTKIAEAIEALRPR